MTGRSDTEGPIATPEFDQNGPPVDVISRWERFGGAWRVVARTEQQVTISLCRCDGGEEQLRLTSADPALFAWLGERSSSSAGR